MATNHILLEISYALIHNQLCFFTGAGFSKAITNGEAPSWKDLLEKVCKNNDIEKDILEQDSLNLEEKAQLISEKLKDKGKKKTIYNEISSIISSLNLSDDGIDSIKEFFSSRKFRVITTNYDKLTEKLINNDYNSFSPGKPIPRIEAKVDIYHIHGSIDSPAHMVVTAEDYFRFINYESYFSRKLSTSLHENLVVILGYSLSDINLKAIINEYKGFSNNQYIPINIIFISREETSQYTKDYYLSCFGIRVIDSLEINDFFKELNIKIKEVIELKDKKIQDIKKVLYENYSYSIKYLKKVTSLFEIVSSIQALGVELSDENVTNLLSDVLKKKMELTGNDGAWDQYYQLALWLIYLNSIIYLKESKLRDIILEYTMISLSNCKKIGTWASPWEATKEWKYSWSNIIPDNRLIIKEYAKKNLTNDFAKKNILGI
ncbi:SIR2 family NAD-dependent protein deacylase [Rodentibacter caecimuris]|uniref:SIR2 family NAD-dependent protein deacylase n=1 Tax=Rodentibacter caecimuris TaxID=1796644 RepID=UPI002119BDB3|nr:SIR2 family protein [Rodentibacter heylii]MCQ9123792.1 SIR2 family protein [Rodentibacter heylii]